MSATTEPTVTHPAWCDASECAVYKGMSDVEHRTIPRPITMQYVTGPMYLSGFAGAKDATPDHLMVHPELKHAELVEEMLVMLNPAEARTFATGLLEA